MTRPSNPRKMLPRCFSPNESFDEKYIPEPNSGCWLWIGCTKNNGYGILAVNGRKVHAHRFSYERFKAPLTPDLVIDHLCRVRCCVNPDHLEEVTFLTNVRRGERSQRASCSNGHPRTAENIYVNPRNGLRSCRVCLRAKALRGYHKRRASI